METIISTPRLVLNLAICGPGECGKDEAAKFLASITDLKYTGSTSQAALDFVWQKYLRSGHYVESFGYKLCNDEYKTKEEFYQARSKHRIFWAEAIDEYNKDDPARLYREHVNHGANFLTGIRRFREFRAAKREQLFDLSIWIENPRAPVDLSLDYTARDCDITILNDRSVNHLHYKLKRLADALGITRIGLLSACRAIQRNEKVKPLPEIHPEYPQEWFPPAGN